MGVENHGVHLGDLYATLASVVVAILITVWIVVDHMSKQRRYDRMARRAAAAERANPEPWPPQDEPADDVPYDGYEEYQEYQEYLIERPDREGRHRTL